MSRASATAQIFSEAIDGASDLTTPAAGAEGDYWSSVVASRPPAGGSLWRAHSDQVNSALLRRWLPPLAGLRVLKTDLFDEALAAGLYPALAPAARVVGIDVSPAVVAAARRRYAQLDAVVADVRRLPFDDGEFDVAVSISTLDHFESRDDLRRGLHELHRVLAPGGRLVVTLDNALNPVVALRNRLPLRLLRSVGVVPYFVGETCGPSGLRRLLGEAGFAVEDTTCVLHCPRALGVLGATLVERRADDGGRTRYLRFLERFERLDHAPTRNVTGYFVAARATRR
ncbi:MAG TPA: class I SAM-dependent methyltransferase [Gaiellaceae bacterium]